MSGIRMFPWWIIVLGGRFFLMKSSLWFRLGDLVIASIMLCVCECKVSLEVKAVH